MQKLPFLGDITPAQFLRDYWQKKPLLIRQAFPGFKPYLTFEQLLELARQNHVESRLVNRVDGQWNLQHGPLAELPPRTQREWTMLVQGVNLYDERADALLRQFRFVPDTRLDDLMISFATDGGGVGPHYDSYDVFLLQAHGKRRWRIGPVHDDTLIDGLPVKILANFEPEEEYVLEPGDMLYLPPMYAHDGIAEGECMTYSVGFRVPNYQEMGENFLQFMADSIDLPGVYEDPALTPAKNPAEIPKDMLVRLTEELNKVRWDEEDVTIFVGEYMSEPKHNVFFTGPAKPLTFGRFLETAAKKGLKLSLKTIMLYRGKHVFINGESFNVGRNDKAVLDVLANARRLDGAMMEQASDDVREALYTWYQDGWLELA
ncbi:MAG TPA: cupin domain-containing protein [Telluria sp.]|nr:cupin domain-containing protein [Telluria sp.]